MWGSGSGSDSATCQPVLLAAPLSAIPSVASLMPCSTRANCIHGCLWSMMVSPATHADTEARDGGRRGPSIEVQISPSAFVCSLLLFGVAVHSQLLGLHLCRSLSVPLDALGLTTHARYGG